jgi:hypothetical protein
MPNLQPLRSLWPLGNAYKFMTPYRVPLIISCRSGADWLDGGSLLHVDVADGVAIARSPVSPGSNVSWEGDASAPLRPLLEDAAGTRRLLVAVVDDIAGAQALRGALPKESRPRTLWALSRDPRVVAELSATCARSVTPVLTIEDPRADDPWRRAAGQGAQMLALPPTALDPATLEAAREAGLDDAMRGQGYWVEDSRADSTLGLPLIVYPPADGPGLVWRLARDQAFFAVLTTRPQLARGALMGDVDALMTETAPLISNNPAERDLAYETSRVDVEMGLGWLETIAPGQRVSERLREAVPFHVLTGFNPGRLLTATENRAAQARLLEALDEVKTRDLRPALGRDVDGVHVEDSVAVFGLDRKLAVSLGRKFGQEAVFEVLVDGLHVISCGRT